MIRINNVLTPEQQAKLGQLMREHRGNRPERARRFGGERRGPQGRGRGAMGPGQGPMAPEGPDTEE